MKKLFKEFDTRDRSIEDSTIDVANVELLNIAKKEGIETAFDRVQNQEPKCKFCIDGVSCRNCNMGPCRITPHGQKGVCGATADTMVARGLLKNAMGGSSAHQDHARHAAITLYEAGKGKAPYKITGQKRLRELAGELEIPDADKEDINKLAIRVVEKAFEDLGRQHGIEVPHWIRIRASRERQETWQKLGVMPVGGNVTISEGMHRQTMGVDADPVNLVLGTVKVGIADGYFGLHLSTDLQDVLFGPPQPKVSEAGIGVMEENMVNIACHGHVPILSAKIVEVAERLDEEAKYVGADGINVIGICCTGNEILERYGIPHAGNELNQELAIVTGAMDAMVVDYQCIFPGIVPVAECFHTKIITTAPIAKISNAEHVEFSEEKADEVAELIVRRGIENFENRNKSKVNIPKHKSEVLAGFSPQVLIEVLSKVNEDDPLKPLIDNVVSGNIRGVVGIVGCNNPKVTHDYMHVKLAKELIKRNVLVISTGCAATAHAKAGTMSEDGYEMAGDELASVLKALGPPAGLKALPPVIHFGSCVDNSRIEVLLNALASKIGVAVKDLPVVASAPEYTTEKALAIGTWAVSLGINTHVNPPPRIAGSEKVTELLTVTAKELLGGAFFTGNDPVKVAEKMVDIIDEKRKGLNIQI